MCQPVCSRSLKSLSFCDDRLQQNFAKMVFTILLDASSSIAVLDLSENSVSGALMFNTLSTINYTEFPLIMLQIGGWLSHFKWGPSSYSKLSFGKGKSLKSLRVLNLRYLLVFFNINIMNSSTHPKWWIFLFDIFIWGLFLWRTKLILSFH